MFHLLYMDFSNVCIVGRVKGLQSLWIRDEEFVYLIFPCILWG